MSHTQSGIPAQLSLFRRKAAAPPVKKAPLDDDLPSWLARFLREATQETDALRENGAEQAAAARTGLLKKLIPERGHPRPPGERSWPAQGNAGRSPSASVAPGCGCMKTARAARCSGPFMSTERRSESR